MTFALQAGNDHLANRPQAEGKTEDTKEKRRTKDEMVKHKQ